MASLLSPELKTFVAQRYIAAGVQPKELVAELKRDFGIDRTAAQLRQFISRSGLAERKREVDAKTCALVSSAQATIIAKQRAALPAANLERWAEQAVSVADAAFEAASRSGRVRDLASATSAASTAIRMYHTCAGLTPGTSGREETGYEWAVRMSKIKPVPIVDVEAKPVAPVAPASSSSPAPSGVAPFATEPAEAVPGYV